MAVALDDKYEEKLDVYCKKKVSRLS